MGLQTSTLYAGGNVPGGLSEIWDGTSWTEVADLSTSREGGSPAGTTAAGLVGGGNIAPLTAATEEWNAAASNLNVDLA